MKEIKLLQIVLSGLTEPNSLKGRCYFNYHYHCIGLGLCMGSIGLTVLCFGLIGGVIQHSVMSGIVGASATPQLWNLSLILLMVAIMATLIQILVQQFERQKLVLYGLSASGLWFIVSVFWLLLQGVGRLMGVL